MEGRWEARAGAEGAYRGQKGQKPFRWWYSACGIDDLIWEMGAGSQG